LPRLVSLWERRLENAQKRRFENVVQKNRRRRWWSTFFIGGGCVGILSLDLVLHLVAFPLNEDGFGMVQKPVQHSRCQRAVIVENLRSLFEGPIGRHNRRTLLVTQADNLEKQISAALVDGQIPQFDQNQHRGTDILFQFGLQRLAH
jgi:hypothetical protein